MDYIAQPADLLDRCSPIRRRLPGHAATKLGYVLPQDEDVPLRAWWQVRQQAAVGE